MLSSWWFIWMIFMLMFLVSPISYGWGYRRWGAPYPSYIQRRRQAAALQASSSYNHQSWGRGGDFIWFIIFIGVIWAIAVFWGGSQIPWHTT